MSKRHLQKMVNATHYQWRIFQRNGVFYADGRRSGQLHLGKFSLDTRNEKEALKSLYQLDRTLAIKAGLILHDENKIEPSLTIPEGWEKFMSHCARPAIVGGVSPNTFKRYRAVKDKHLIFCQSGGIRDWKQVDKKSAYEYASYLQKEGYANRTIYLELNLLVGIVKWLIEEQLLPASAQFQLKLSKPQGSETYCYTSEEVSAMTSYCQSYRELAWIQNIIVTLANTGFRIGELISLRWEDIDLKANTIQLKDERATVKKKMLGIARTTKGKLGRSIPLHPVLRKTLISMGILRNGFVFQGPKGGTLKADVVRRALIRNILEPLSSQFPQAPGVI